MVAKWVCILSVFILPFTTLVLIPGPATAADTPANVVTVDINRVINGLEEANQLKAELKNLSDKTQKELERKRESLRAIEKQVEREKDNVNEQTLTKLRQQTRDFERFMKDSKEELQQRFLKVNRELSQKAIEGVRDYAKQHKIDIVIDRRDNGGVVIFHNSSADITDSVLKTLR